FSLFFLYKMKPWLRAGFETVVGNSDEKASTTFNFQGVGLVPTSTTVKSFSLRAAFTSDQ
ncbi:MAG: hypothetical protein ACE5HX_04305, partial [bacterium]